VEAAAAAALATTGGSIRDLRITEVLRQDVTIENGKVAAFRVRDLVQVRDGRLEVGHALEAEVLNDVPCLGMLCPGRR
jgi:flavin-binding protein dodecin